MSALLQRIPWEELQESYSPGVDGNPWPLSAMTPNDVHKYLILLKDARCFGTIYNDADPITFDNVFSEGTLTTSSELQRVKQWGFEGRLCYDIDGNLVDYDDPDGRAHIIFLLGAGNWTFDYADLGADRDVDRLNNNFVKYDSGSLYIPLAVYLQGASDQEQASAGSGGSVCASVDLTVFGDAVSTYSVIGNSLVADVTIEIPPTDTFLSFGGVRDVDTGAALVTGI